MFFVVVCTFVDVNVVQDVIIKVLSIAKGKTIFLNDPDRLSNAKIFTKLGRICSNSFKFRFFEFHTTIVEFGLI